MLTEEMDLSNLLSRDRRYKLTRVFRDPSLGDDGTYKPKFELWIAFKFDGHHLINAQVLKSNGVGKPHDRLKVSAIDVQLAIAAVTELANHQTAINGIYRFIDYNRDYSFDVEGSELMPLLQAQLQELKPKVRQPNGGTKQELKTVKDEKLSLPPGASNIMIQSIDDVLDESYKFIRNFRSTNPD